jgi:hypothetical protein
LFAADGSLIDSVTFAQQTNNVSQGHYPAGTGPVYFMTTPTPRIANVDPNPSTSPEILRINSVSGTQVAFVVSTIPGRTYRVVYKPDLGAPEWIALGSDQPADNTTLTFQYPATGAQRFYRVLLLP